MWMPKGHPGCQAPDGAEPCPQFTEAMDRIRKLEHDHAQACAAIDRLRAEMLEKNKRIYGLEKALQDITNLCKTEPANPFLADKMDRVALSALGEPR